MITMISMKNHKGLIISALAVLFVIQLVSIACNLPVGSPDTVEAEQILNGQLQGIGLQAVIISIENHVVTVAYAQPFIQDEETLLVCWFGILSAATDAVPNAKEVVLQISYLGEPYLNIAAQVKDIESLKSGHTTPDEFFQHLEFTDGRTSERAIRQGLERSGYIVTGVKVSQNIVEIEFFQPVVSGASELAASWFTVFDLAARSAPEVDSVRLMVLGGSDLIVEASMQDIQDYQNREMNAAEFLLAIQQ